MPSEPLNKRFGKYLLIKKLATGGMATIYLAEYTGPGGFKKQLVIKQILPQLADDEKFVQMFYDEGRVAAMMNHPNIVQIFEMGVEEEDKHYIAMEYVPGYNLRKVIQLLDKNGIWLAPEYIAKIGSQICDGLDYAHNFRDSEGNHLNIIHRDVSPQNLILSVQGTVKIVDFGIAKAKSNFQETQAGVIKGKLAYMSPEQIKNMKLDRRSDIFSLGIVLYELATHRRPFRGKSDLELLRSILQDPPTPIEKFRSDFPKELSQIIYKALAKDRDKRYSTARELQWDLEKFIQSWGRPIGTSQLQEVVRHLRQFEGSADGKGAKGKSGAPVDSVSSNSVPSSPVGGAPSGGAEPVGDSRNSSGGGNVPVASAGGGGIPVASARSSAGVGVFLPEGKTQKSEVGGSSAGVGVFLPEGETQKSEVGGGAVSFSGPPQPVLAAPRPENLAPPGQAGGSSPYWKGGGGAGGDGHGDWHGDQSESDWDDEGEETVISSPAMGPEQYQNYYSNNYNYGGNSYLGGGSGLSDDDERTIYEPNVQVGGGAGSTGIGGVSGAVSGGGGFEGDFDDDLVTITQGATVLAPAPSEVREALSQSEKAGSKVYLYIFIVTAVLFLLLLGGAVYYFLFLK